MKTSKLLILLLCFFVADVAYSQSQKEINLQKNRVQIFNDEERANVQYHFYMKTKELKLSDDAEAEYSRIVIFHTYDMARLDDKDQNNSDEEMRSKLKALVKKMDAEVKPILTAEQFKLHQKNFRDVLQSAYRARNWKWDLD